MALPDWNEPKKATTNGGMTYEEFSRLMLTQIAPPPHPRLSVISSPHPVLGWRQWRVGDTPTLNKVGMFGLYGQHWETPEMRARCAKGHDAPAENCRCGIYFYKHPLFAEGAGHSGKFVEGIIVATNVIEHEYGYRAGLVRCIAISGIHPLAYGWDGIPIMPGIELGKYIESLRDNPNLIPYPNDIPAP